MWLPLACPLLGTWPATQACALTGNQTGDSLLHKPTLNPLSYTSQGGLYFFIVFNIIYVTNLKFPIITYSHGMLFIHLAAFCLLTGID